MNMHILLEQLKTVVSKVDCTALRRVVGAEKQGGGWKRAASSAFHLISAVNKVRFTLFTAEMTSDQTLGKWYHIVKPIYRNKNLLKVKNVTKYGISFYWYHLPYCVAQTAVLNNNFFKVG
jgi:hypothetical protein